MVTLLAAWALGPAPASDLPLDPLLRQLEAVTSGQRACPRLRSLVLTEREGVSVVARGPQSVEVHPRHEHSLIAEIELGGAEELQRVALSVPLQPGDLAAALELLQPRCAPGASGPWLQPPSTEAPPAPVVVPTLPDPEIFGRIAEATVAALGEGGRAWVIAEAGQRVRIGAGGAPQIEPIDQLIVRLAGEVGARDGGRVTDQILFVGRASGGLTVEPFEAAAHSLAEQLEAWTRGEVYGASYAGPVLFEGAAAVDLFRHQLVPGIVDPPGEAAPAWALQQQVLPGGWSVIDDPDRFTHAPAAFRYDPEGVIGAWTELVVDGIVVDHLTSLASGQGRASNGHARTAGGQIAAMPSNLLVRPHRSASEARLHHLAWRAARRRGLDHYLVIHRLQDPALVPGAGGWLREPVGLSRVSRDGRRQPIRGLSLQEVHLSGLVAAGEPQRHAMMVPLPGQRPTPDGGVPVLLSAPSVLFDAVSLIPTEP